MSFCWCLLYSVCLSVSNAADRCLEWMFRAWWANLRQQFHLQKRSSSRLGAGRRSECRRLQETIDLADCLSCRKCCESCGGREGAWTSLSVDASDHKEVTTLFSAWLPACRKQGCGLEVERLFSELQMSNMVYVLLLAPVCKQNL